MILFGYQEGMIVMTIEEMQERKRELGYSYEKLAEISGIPLGTVQKILGGITKTPRYEKHEEPWRTALRR